MSVHTVPAHFSSHGVATAAVSIDGAITSLTSTRDSADIQRLGAFPEPIPGIPAARIHDIIRLAHPDDGEVLGSYEIVERYLPWGEQDPGNPYTIVAVDDPDPLRTALVILFKESGKYYTEERWAVPDGAIHPSDLRRSPDARSLGGPVLVTDDNPWHFPHLLTL